MVRSISLDASGRQGGTRSLDVVEDVVRRERDAQLRHWDALDAKAGVMLGFAGAVAALAPVRINPIVDGDRLLAVTGGLLALWAFWPRGFGAVKLRAFRDRYLASDPRFTRLHLADSLIAGTEEAAAVLERKGARVKWSMALLALGARLLAFGLVVG